nr:hypothetical protein [Tanacetum cinerariifolium]
MQADNARCVGLIRVAAATWVPPSVVSKDILTLFKATDLKTFVHGDFDYDVMDIDITIARSNLSMQKNRPHTIVMVMCTTADKPSVSNVLFHTKIYINENIPEIVAFRKRKITVVILVRDRCPRGKVPGPMTHLVTSLTPDSANSCVMQGASYTQRKISMVLFVLPYVLLLVLIVVTIMIVVVISIVFVVTIVRVVVVVVGSIVSSINKLSLVISSSNAISNQLPDGSLSHNWCCGFDLTGDEDPSDEDGGTGMGDSTGVSVSLGEISLEGNTYWESNIGESDNTKDGGKIAGRAITT